MHSKNGHLYFKNIPAYLVLLVILQNISSQFQTLNNKIIHMKKLMITKGV